MTITIVLLIRVKFERNIKVISFNNLIISASIFLFLHTYKATKSHWSDCNLFLAKSNFLFLLKFCCNFICKNNRPWADKLFFQWVYRKLFIHLIFATKDRINFLPPFILSSWMWNQLGFSLLLYAVLIFGANTRTIYVWLWQTREQTRSLCGPCGELAKFSRDKETFNFFDKFLDCS